jgi:hypothetical protein
MVTPSSSNPSSDNYQSKPPQPARSESTPDQPKTEAELDKELADSFPTSDPLSSWAGAD